MPPSHFIRRLPRRVRRFLPGPVRSPGLETRLDLRPARFTVGLGERVRWGELEDLSEAPVNVAFYLGRVEEVTGDEVLATVWERPSGREAATTLSVEKHFKGRRPMPGNLLRIWTWVELPGKGARRDRAHVEVEAPRLSDREREELKAFLESLSTEEEEREGERDHET